MYPVQGSLPTSSRLSVLHPLPIPRRSWSHASADFITGLPKSKDNTVIFVVVERVFRLPQDIVSDCGPQFSSWVWRAFCRLFGATASLSSDFHPQSNGQTEELEATLKCMVRYNPAFWVNSKYTQAQANHSTHLMHPDCLGNIRRRV